MIHLKYKCKVNFVKLPLILIYLCLKLVFENATACRNTGWPLGCELRARQGNTNPLTFPAFLESVEIS